MKIHTYEQFGFIVESDVGKRIAFDIGALTPAETVAQIPAVDAVYISHIHADHMHLGHLQTFNTPVYGPQQVLDELADSGLELHLVEAGKEYDVAGMQINPFIVDHGPNAQPADVEVLGCLIKVDNKISYFSSDIKVESSVIIPDERVDLLMVPVGGYYTFDPSEAVRFVKLFPDVGTVIPMHYQAPILDPRCKKHFIELSDGEFEIVDMEVRGGKVI